MQRGLLVAVLVMMAGCGSATRAAKVALTADAGWERVDLEPRLFPPGATVNGFAVLGSRLLAVGHDAAGAGAAWSSVDGRQWARASGPQGGSELAFVAATGRTAYALAWDRQGRARSSGWVTQDGLTWASARSPLGDARGGYVGTLSAVGGRLLATGVASLINGPSLWSSPDGQVWTPATAAGDFSTLSGAAVSRQGVVLVGHANEFGGPVVLRSGDGTTWRAGSISAPPGTGQAETEAVAQLRGRLVAVGRASEGDTPRLAIWTSSDGATWTEHPDGPLLVSGTFIRSMSATSAAVAALAVPGTLNPSPPTLLLSSDGTAFQPVALARPTFGGHLSLTATTSFGDALWVIGRDERGPAMWRWPGPPTAVRHFAVSLSATTINPSTPPPFRVTASPVGTVAPGERALVTLTFAPTTAQPYVLRFTGATWTPTAVRDGGGSGELPIAGTMCDTGTCQPSPLILFVGLAAPADCRCNYGGENLPNPPWVTLTTDNIVPGSYHTDAPVEWSTLQDRFKFNPVGHGLLRITVDVRPG